MLFRSVRRITLKSESNIEIAIARKQLRLDPRFDLARLQEEIATAQRLEGKPHITRVIGAYQKTNEDAEETFNILTFPVADCDLKFFLKNCEDLVESLQPNREGIWRMLMKAAAVDLTPEMAKSSRSSQLAIPERLVDFLKRGLGCMTQAIAWMHERKVAHHDLKSDNVLLRNGRLYITDFGLSKDRSGQTQTHTDVCPGGTMSFAAREIREGKQNSPFRADIYSLGCIFMHVVTVAYFQKPIAGCSLILGGDCSLREAKINYYLQDSSATSMNGGYFGPPQKLRDLMSYMLKDDRYERPEISDINNWLTSIGGDKLQYHGKCCCSTQHCPNFSAKGQLWRERIQRYLALEHLEEQIRLVEKLDRKSTRLNSSHWE